MILPIRPSKSLRFRYTTPRNVGQTDGQTEMVNQDRTVNTLTRDKDLSVKH